MYLSRAKLASFVLGGSAKWICHAALTAVGDSCAHWLWRQWASVPRWGPANNLHGSVRTTDKSYCCLPSLKAHALTPGSLCSSSMYADNNNEKMALHCLNHFGYVKAAITGRVVKGGPVVSIQVMGGRTTFWLRLYDPREWMFHCSLRFYLQKCKLNERNNHEFKEGTTELWPYTWDFADCCIPCGYLNWLQVHEVGPDSATLKKKATIFFEIQCLHLSNRHIHAQNTIHTFTLHIPYLTRL